MAGTSKTKEYRKQYSKEYRESGRKRISILKSTYGLSQIDFESMWKNQGGSCPICGALLELRKGGYTVDHDHETGQIRGIFCAACNLGLGGFKDSVLSLLNAIIYLKRIK